MKEGATYGRRREILRKSERLTGERYPGKEKETQEEIERLRNRARETLEERMRFRRRERLRKRERHSRRDKKTQEESERETGTQGGERLRGKRETEE